MVVGQRQQQGIAVCLVVLLMVCVGCGDDSSGSGTTAADGGIIGGGGDSNNTSGNSDGGVTSGDDGGTSPEDDAGDGGMSGTEERRNERVLESTTVTLNRGISESVSFEVPENVVSVTVIIEGADRTSYTLASWQDGSGEPLVFEGWVNTDPSAPSICTTCANRVSASSGVAAALAPNNQNSFINPGTHTVSVFGIDINGFSGSPASGPAQVTAVAKVLPEFPDAGVVDLNIHFTGAGGWSASTAPADPDFQQMMTEVDTIYNQVGIRLGDITYRDIDSNFRIIENILSDDSDLQLLFSQSEGNSSNAVNLFFVEELAALQGGGGPGLGLILGIAGGIPGPPLLQGSTRSGVAVAVESHDDPQVPSRISNTVAHEVGHFLGLFHTSEQALFGPQLHDPLDDTPENDVSYLMHNMGSGSTLSPWQGRVMRANPWIRH